MFIYLITNDVNEKAYVGLFSGKRLRSRWAVHKWDARGTSELPIHRAMRKHGIEKFHISSVWSGYISRENLARLEQYYIASFNTKTPNGYNLTDGGDGSIGFVHSEEAKAKLRGRIVSESTRQKMSLIHKGKTISEAQKASVSIKMRGNKHLLGHIHSFETRVKLGAARKGRKDTEETRKKKSASAKAFLLRKSSEVNNQPRREEAKIV